MQGTELKAELERGNAAQGMRTPGVPTPEDALLRKEPEQPQEGSLMV